MPVELHRDITNWQALTNQIEKHQSNNWMVLKTTSFVFGLAMLVGCATPEYNYMPLVTDISEPPIGSVNVAYVGDNMLRQGKYKEHQAIRLDDEVKVGMVGNYRFTAGHYLKEGEEGELTWQVGGDGSKSSFPRMKRSSDHLLVRNDAARLSPRAVRVANRQCYYGC